MSTKMTVKESTGMVIKDLKLANAVKIGHHEVSYFHSDHYNITIQNSMMIKISKKLRHDGEKPEEVHTTVMNAISWHK